MKSGIGSDIVCNSSVIVVVNRAARTDFALPFRPDKIDMLKCADEASIETVETVVTGASGANLFCDGVEDGDGGVRVVHRKPLRGSCLVVDIWQVAGTRGPDDEFVVGETGVDLKLDALELEGNGGPGEDGFGREAVLVLVEGK